MSERISTVENGVTPFRDENGILIGQVRLRIDDDLSGFDIAILWNPELVVSMPDFVREALVEHLRKHADKLESGEQAEGLAKHLDPENTGGQA